MNSSNRSNHEIFSDILRAIDTDGATINEILFKTYISYQRLKKYLTFLIQLSLISYRKEEKRFRITQQGFHALIRIPKWMNYWFEKHCAKDQSTLLHFHEALII